MVCINSVNRRQLNELFEEIVPILLQEDDLNSMSVSIENRSPFLDKRLFETAFSIPTRHLIRDGRAKAVLREAMRGIVPDKILDSRRKVGFNVPINNLLDSSEPEIKEKILAPSPVFDLVQRTKIEELIGTKELKNSDSKFLFNFLNAKIFLEQAIHRKQ